MAKTNVMSRSAATNLLKRFYSKNTTEIELTFDQIMAGTERTTYPTDKNKKWLSNMLTSLKYYGFINVSYSNGRPRRFEKVKLLDEGKVALGRAAGSQPETQTQTTLLKANAGAEVLLESVNNDVEALRKLLPSFDILFDIRPKGINHHS